MIKKTIQYIILVWLCSCNTPKSLSKNREDILFKIYQSQKEYFDNNVFNKADYKPIIDFALKGRYVLYEKNGVSLNYYSKMIILEGILNSNGMYAGLMFCDTTIYYYKNDILTGWHFSKLNNNSNLEEATGIRKDVIGKVKNWDTIYIQKLKKQVGSTITDGFSFIASRITYSNKIVSAIETLGFYEFK